VSVTNPLCKSSYASLPQSPATSFLAQFAQPDDWRGQEEVKDGAIINNYRVGKVIGRGSFSECREAIFDDGSEDERERVAMKIVKAEKAESDNLSDFDKELSVWRRLSHDNILPLLDCIRSDGIRTMVPFQKLKPRLFSDRYAKQYSTCTLITGLFTETLNWIIFCWIASFVPIYVTLD
jgi:serine/threonine protein kinase